jgi:predicted ester cyclase
MSVEANKALIRRAVDLFSRETLEPYLELYHPDAKLHFLPPGMPQGRAGARAYYGMYLGAFPDARVRIDRMIGEGDVVAVGFTITGTQHGEFRGIPPTGRHVTITGMSMLRVEQGLIVERWSEADFLGLLQQIGAIGV